MSDKAIDVDKIKKAVLKLKNVMSGGIDLIPNKRLNVVLAHILSD